MVRPLGLLLLAARHAGTGHAATVTHVFEVGYFQADPDRSGPAWIQGINGSMPGPEIRVRRGDRLRVELRNKCATEHLTIHWHGLEMRKSQEYDGAMQITQCGVEPMHTFVYDFEVDDSPGTYQYHEHAHLEHVAARGLFGALVVEEPAGSPGLWSYDGDEVLLFSDYWHQSNHELERVKQARLIRPASVSALGNAVGLLPFHNLLINGKGAFNVFGDHVRDGFVGDLATLVPKAGETWRLRLVNGGAMFAMRFRIDRHRLRVIQADAADVEPYDCDAVTMSSGERFDVLVTFDQAPGSYWMRLETLEGRFGIHHGQLGVIRYANTSGGAEPDKGHARRHRIEDSPELITLNCVDQAPISPTCRPITDLRRHASFMDAHVGSKEDSTHDFEISFRAFGGGNPSHLTRLIDLSKHPNTYGEDQFDGEYVQFMPPGLPYSHTEGGSYAEHENSLAMHVSLGETVRVVIQSQDRAAHPWHLHGHKFAVLALGFPNYKETCDILYCRSRNNHWITRDGFPRLLDPEVAPVKDTVHLPAGGWAVLQFKADNPGWWYFHCHMAVHVHDGMGVILVEAPEEIPARLTNRTYLSERGFPSCAEEMRAFEEAGAGTGCSCWQNPEEKINNNPRSSYRCSHAYLCGDQLLSPLEPPEPIRSGARDRASGRDWRFGMLGAELVTIVLIFLFKARADFVLWKEIVGVEANVQANVQARLARQASLRKLETSTRQVIRRMSMTSSTFVERSASLWPIEAATRQVMRRMSMNSRSGQGDSPPGSPRKQAIRRMSMDSKHSLGDTPPEGSRPIATARRPSTCSSEAEVIAAALDEYGSPTQSYALGLESPSQSCPLGLASPEQSHVLSGASPGSQPEETSPSFQAPLSFTAYRAKQPDMSVSGRLFPGSMCVVLGQPEDTAPWLHFFSGRKHQGTGSPIQGNLYVGFDGKHAAQWDQLALDRGCVFIPRVTVMRNTLTVYDTLKFYKTLGHKELLQQHNMRDSHMHRLIELFNLTPYLRQQLRGIDPALLVRVQICRQLFVPRGLLVIEDPFTNMDRGTALLFLKMLKKVTEEFGTTIIFSSSSLLGEAGRHVSHILLAPSNGQPVFGSQDDLSDFCTFIGEPLPKDGNKPCVHWCSELLFSGALEHKANGCGRWEGALNLDQGCSAYRSECSAAEGEEVKVDVKRKLASFFTQCRLLTQFETSQGLRDYFTVFKFAETVGIGITSGIVWFQKGSVETQTALGETIGLLFFTTALWSVPPIFQALTSIKDIFERASYESLSGLYSTFAFVLSLQVSCLPTLVIWAPVWQITAYSMADIGPSWDKMLMMHLVLILNVVTMRTLGLCLALFIPKSSVNVVIGNLFAQLCMLTNGFYTKLPWWFNWITVISIPRYTLRALLKLEFSWRDTFEVHPMQGFAGFGYPTKYIPAEMTGFFQTMVEREMHIMESPKDSSVMPEICIMLGITTCCTLVFALGLRFRIKGLRAPKTEIKGIKAERTPWRGLAKLTLRRERDPPAYGSELSV